VEGHASEGSGEGVGGGRRGLLLFTFADEREERGLARGREGVLEIEGRAKHKAGEELSVTVTALRPQNTEIGR
jgi:hypothetical protein